MKRAHRAICLLLAIGLPSSPVLAQQSIRESATRAATTSATEARDQGQTGHSRAKFWTGAILAAAGGTAIVLGSTVLRTADATSGNTPIGAYDSCLALKSNPVYRGNDCEVLKGPNAAVVIGGSIAAAAGVTFMMLGSPHSSVAFGPGIVKIRHRWAW
jgi:hypothetical protein